MLPKICLSNRAILSFWEHFICKILPIVGLTGQFCQKSVQQDNFVFLGVGLTGQLENLGRLTVLVM